jgi:hypothetical protein
MFNAISNDTPKYRALNICFSCEFRTPILSYMIKICHGEPWASNRDAAPWWFAGRRRWLAPLARPAQELKGPATPLPSVPHHTRFSFAPTHPLHFSVAPRRLGGAVGSFAAAPGQTQEEEYEDRVEERGWRGDGWRRRTEMGKVVLCLSALICLFACPRRRLFCIWLQWALVGLGFADAIVASPTIAAANSPLSSHRPMIRAKIWRNCFVFLYWCRSW